MTEYKITFTYGSGAKNSTTIRGEKVDVAKYLLSRKPLYVIDAVRKYLPKEEYEKVEKILKDNCKVINLSIESREISDWIPVDVSEVLKEY